MGDGYYVYRADSPDLQWRNHRLLKACHGVVIKRRQIDHLVSVRWEKHGDSDEKKQNSGQNRKSSDKNVLKHWGTLPEDVTIGSNDDPNWQIECN
jgi:hypothetical protein